MCMRTWVQDCCRLDCLAATWSTWSHASWVWCPCFSRWVLWSLCPARTATCWCCQSLWSCYPPSGTPSAVPSPRGLRTRSCRCAWPSAPPRPESHWWAKAARWSASAMTCCSSRANPPSCSSAPPPESQLSPLGSSLPPPASRSPRIRLSRGSGTAARPRRGWASPGCSRSKSPCNWPWCSTSPAAARWRRRSGRMRAAWCRPCCPSSPCARARVPPSPASWTSSRCPSAPTRTPWPNTRPAPRWSAVSRLTAGRCPAATRQARTRARRSTRAARRSGSASTCCCSP